MSRAAVKARVGIDGPSSRAAHYVLFHMPWVGAHRHESLPYGGRGSSADLLGGFAPMVALTSWPGMHFMSRSASRTFASSAHCLQKP